MSGNFGYQYICTCGTWISTENGLDYKEQLDFLIQLVTKHRQEHVDRMIAIENGTVL